MSDPRNTPGEPGLPPDGLDDIDRGGAWLTGIGLGALVLVALIISFIIGTRFSDEPSAAPPAGETAPAAPQEVSGPGRELFITKCGSCHMVEEAGTAGTAGPNLDGLKPTAEVVRQAIVTGGTGSGAMPPGLATGQELDQIAEYVAAATAGG